MARPARSSSASRALSNAVGLPDTSRRASNHSRLLTFCQAAGLLGDPRGGETEPFQSYAPGAEAPKVDIPMDAPSRPT